MSTRFRFFVGEAVRSLRANIATTLAATVTVLIVMFFLGVFVALGSYLYAKVDQVRGETKVSVYLKDDVLNRQVGNLEVRLRQNPDVKSVVYLSKAAALTKMKKQLGKDNNVFKQLPVNPLPASLEVHLHDPNQAKAVAATVHGRAGVDSVDYGGKTADRVLRVGATIEAVVGGLILVLAIAAVLLIANTIRLSIHSRRREIEVMKLVGATNWFVRLPFVIEGMLCGLVGAAVAIVLLYASYVGLLRSWIQGSDLSSSQVQAISFWLLGALLIVAGTGLGAVGSGLTLRRYLRV
ncbi:MAG: cell division transport system permease protein [Gaiellales bacterium]|jgi:cell division transport system permease protein|nr:cell division transport system permease protein [Gaiellales bacterium]